MNLSDRTCGELLEGSHCEAVGAFVFGKATAQRRFRENLACVTVPKHSHYGPLNLFSHERECGERYVATEWRRVVNANP